MPHATIDIVDNKCVVRAHVGIGPLWRGILTKVKQAVPQVEVLDAVIDTGAQRSVIDERIAKRVGLYPCGELPFCTPSSGNNQVMFPIYEMVFGLYEHRRNYWLAETFFLAAGPPMPGVGMLLGMDILSHCSLFVDGPSKRFTLGI
jgi:hypothetical protein